MNYSLNNGLYCSEQVLFGQLLNVLKSSIMGCVDIFRDYMDGKVEAIVHA